MSREDIIFYHSRFVLDLAGTLCRSKTAWDDLSYRTREKYIQLAAKKIQYWLEEKMIRMGNK
jgi:hypothetical protein